MRAQLQRAVPEVYGFAEYPRSIGIAPGLRGLTFLVRDAEGRRSVRSVPPRDDLPRFTVAVDGGLAPAGRRLPVREGSRLDLASEQRIFLEDAADFRRFCRPEA